MSTDPKNGKTPRGEGRFMKEYIHWRSKKLMRAKDYGYVAWFFLNKKKGS